MEGNGHAKDKNLLRIGSRDSELAMKQTYMVRDALQKANPHLKFDIVSMKTKGDKILNMALSKIGSKSLFTKELEVALEEGVVDIVVHSLKDLPTILPEGMVIGAVSEREDPRDAVIMHPKYAECTLASLPKGSVIGTSSLRRSAQLKRRYPNLRFESVRGNLNTRLRKLDSADDYAALILAAAGVVRMGWKDRISQYLGDDLCMYAVGQGALAVECREGDSDTLDLLAHIADPNTTIAAVAERGFMRTLEGGCSAPVAVHTKVTEDSVSLKGGVWSLDGSEELLDTMSTSSQNPDASPESTQPPEKVAKTSINFCGIVILSEHKDFMTQAHQLGVSLAQRLLDKGADRILKAAKAQNVINVPPVTSSTSAISLEEKEAEAVNGS
ncbi:porphobilinogen deaminase-like [Homarus americanus]|uniref:porphobilinogen deaminase-like n=1 Tax=Homarus americanus TaxID=6706 RepID=UPI001C48D765|nr:porphobilinogen deaminase-like [Homarus americanus]